MARELDSKMLTSVKNALKKLSGNDPDAKVSETKVANEAGVPMSMVGKLIWAAEPLVWPSLEIKQTEAAIVNARDHQGLRWERIAARADLPVSQVKEMYERKTGKDPHESYTGRGRRFDGNGSAPAKTTGQKRGAASAGRATSGRRAAANKDKGKGNATPQRGRRGARTRAERAAAGKNPS